MTQVEKSGSLSRRSFLMSSAAAGLALVNAPRALSGKTSLRVIGSNERVRLGIAGLRIKGAQHIDIFRPMQGVQVAAICDVDQGILARETAKFTSAGESVKTFTDVRRMLEDPDIDAVIVSSPNHWHSLMGIWACQAGKDVYVEKPVSHSVWEGRQLVRAAQKYGRVVQAGMQKRSDEGLIEAFRYIREGNLGRITLARGLCYKRRTSIGKVNGPQPIPKEIDFDLWTGPARLEPLRRQSLHYDWHWFWDTGNGDLGNQGIHEVDLCRWVLGETGFPRSILSYGGRYGYSDDGETPNTQVIVYDYESAPMIFEVRGLPRSSTSEAMDDYRGTRIGVVIQCENGYFAGGDGGGWAYDNSGKKIRQFTGTGGVIEHAANFIRAVRERKPSDLNGAIEDGHVSSALCHMGNISYRLGTDTDYGTAGKSLSGNFWMEDAFSRFGSHLESNGLPLSGIRVCTGPRLELDQASESFVSKEVYDPAYFANLLLRRDYRSPFIVPEQI
ncbi:MAG: Gfo/Idh/MocA family oxidoreductase [bacterium]|nr:Gfo/Idh/MocA family oxidoreductase [bacterium]